MFEPHYVCTRSLFDRIASVDHHGRSVWDEIVAFNKQVPGSSKCRLVREGSCAPDRYQLQLGSRDIFDLVRLLLTPETRLTHRQIQEWFRPEFLGSNFWTMWSTMFSFQPWHSVGELRRYFRRFIHLFPGFATISGVLRTRYNQYDSLVAPLKAYLSEQGVRFETPTTVADVDIEGDHRSRRVTQLIVDGKDDITVREHDRVYLTLGSMTDGSQLGSKEAAPPTIDGEGPAWRLWRRLAARYEDFGNPEAFCSDTARTGWNSFTVTLEEPGFAQFLESFTGNRSGTGGLLTFDRSGWLLSIVMFHQPHFPDQPQNKCVFWGYGLRADRSGDFVNKSMRDASGREILQELAGHLGLDQEQMRWFENAEVVPCRMPFITSEFMPRVLGDRPSVRPAGSENFAIMGQYCEVPRDCVFTVEYSVRSAWIAVHELTQRVAAPPPVSRTDKDPRVLLRAARVLVGV
jgi:oleate hydratase